MQRNAVVFVLVLSACSRVPGPGAETMRQEEPEEPVRPAQSIVAQPMGNGEVLADPVATGLRGFAIFPFAVKSLAFGPNGRLLAAGSGDGVVRVWEVSKAELRWAGKAHADWAFALAFSPDGKTLASGGGDNLVKLWNPETGQPYGELGGHAQDVHAVAFTHDGRHLVSAGDDMTLRVWNLETRTAGILTGHRGPVTSLAVSGDGRWVASGSRDHSVRLWTLDSEAESSIEFSGHSADVLAVAFSPDGETLASASYDKTVRLWTVRDRKPPRIIQAHQDWAFTIAFSADGRFLASGGGDNATKVWDPATGRLDHEFQFQADVSALAFSPQEPVVAVATADGEIAFFDLRHDEPKKTIIQKSATIVDEGASSGSIPAQPTPDVSPDEYIRLHTILLEPEGLASAETVQRLVAVGDGYTLQWLQRLESQPLQPARYQVLKGMVGRISERERARTPVSVASSVQAQLERAAVADLRCSPLERTLVPWTMNSIRSHMASAVVRGEVERLAKQYEPDHEVTTEFGSLRDRVRLYAADLLSGLSARPRFD